MLGSGRRPCWGEVCDPALDAPRDPESGGEADRGTFLVRAAFGAGSAAVAATNPADEAADASTGLGLHDDADFIPGTEAVRSAAAGLARRATEAIGANNVPWGAGATELPPAAVAAHLLLETAGVVGNVNDGVVRACGFRAGAANLEAVEVAAAGPVAARDQAARAAAQPAEVPPASAVEPLPKSTVA